MRIDVITIFPGYIAPLREALLGRAMAAGLVDLAVHDLRDWTHDVHKAVDERALRRRAGDGHAAAGLG